MSPCPSLVPASCLCFLSGPPCHSTQLTRPQSSSVSPAGSLWRALYVEVTDVALKRNFLWIEGASCKPGPPGAETVSSLLPDAAWGRARLRACHMSRGCSVGLGSNGKPGLCVPSSSGEWRGLCPGKVGVLRRTTSSPHSLMHTLRTLAVAAQDIWSITIPHLGRRWPQTLRPGQ